MSRRRGLFYLPLSPVAFLFFIAVAIVTWLAILTTGQLLGFTPLQTGLAFAAIVLGSAINIPVKKLKGEKVVHVHAVRVFGIRYPVPHTEQQEVVLAVNLGGAVVPVLISGYLLLISGITAAVAAGATAMVTAVVTNTTARPVRGVGIVVPTLIPALTSAAVALVAIAVIGLEPMFLPRIAFAGGVIGALVGADLLNLDAIARIGAPVASIGGAGTFDGILITGVMSVLLGAFALGI